MEEMQGQKKGFELKDILRKISNIVKKHANKIRQYYAHLTVPGMVKFVLLLVAIHLLLAFVRPIPIVFSPRSIRPRISYRMPTSSSATRVLPGTVGTRVKRPVTRTVVK